MNETKRLLQPDECVMVLVDFQAGLAFGVESTARQILLGNAVALARTALEFGTPVVVSTSASRVYSGPLLPTLQHALPSVKPGSFCFIWLNDITLAGRPRLASFAATIIEIIVTTLVIVKTERRDSS